MAYLLQTSTRGITIWRVCCHTNSAYLL
jgi:hypothetical protein